MVKSSRKLIVLLALLAAPLAAAPDTIAGHIEQARTALARGDGIAAKADLDRAVQAGASRTAIAADMGEAFLLQGEGAKAREWLAPGQFAKGQEGRGWRLLGSLERSEWRLPESGKALDRALAFAPRDPLLWIEIGRLRYQGGEQLQAIEAADRAIAAAPENPRAIEFRAQLLRDSHGDAAALALIERGLAVSPNDLSLLGGYAASLGELGRAHDMLAVTRKMLSIDAGNAQAFFLQATLAARAGNVDLARGMMNKAGNRLDKVPAATLLKAILELEAGNANVAAQPLIELANWQDANPRVQALLARSLYDAGDSQQLFARFGAMAQRADASPYLLMILGRAMEEQGDYAQAAALLDRAAAGLSAAVLPQFESDPATVLAPRWQEAQADTVLTVDLVRGLLGSGNTAAAGQVAGRLVELRPGSQVALSLAGDVELLGGRPANALPYYDRAAKIRLTDNLLLRSAIAMERSGKAPVVPVMIANYLQLNPGSRLAARIAASQALMRKDWVSARNLLENLRKRGGNNDARLLADLSTAQLNSGDAAAALLSAERAWQIAPASAFAAQARGLALVALGRDTDLARQLLEQARKMAGDNPLLAQALRKLH